jgi:lipopolysaccharide transport system ATP-binding protein
MEAFVKKGVTIIFISHNLQAVVNLCSRALLLRKGSVVESGPTGQVVRRYLSEAASPARGDVRDRTIWIESVSVVDEEGKEADLFTAGDKVSVIINVRSNVREDALAVTLDFLDENNRSVFNTSSERLGHGVFAVAPDESKIFRYDIILHLVEGNFFLKVEVKNYRVERSYDVLFPAASIFVHSDKGIKGTANLYPVFREENAPLVADKLEIRRT